jgi:hypothetical protein
MAAKLEAESPDVIPFYGAAPQQIPMVESVQPS